MTPFVIHPRDPLIFRDGRPFGSDPGSRARTLPWPFPGTVAGALRTHFGLLHGGGRFCPEFVDTALGIPVRGPILGVRESPDATLRAFFPAPRDAVAGPVDDKGRQPTRLSPMAGDGLGGGSGCDLPYGLRPAMLVSSEARKPGWTVPLWWSWDATERWLLGNPAPPVPNSGPPIGTLHYHGHMAHERRIHVAINTKTGTAEDGFLFQTDGLRFRDEARPSADPPLGRGEGYAVGPETVLLGRVDPPAGASSGWNRALISIGGERRLAHLESPGTDPWPSLPKPLCEALIGKKRLRVQLVTPGWFDDRVPERRKGDAANEDARRPGWCPPWLEEEDGVLAGYFHGFRLVLRAAVVGRWEPVSGWDLAKARENRLNNKPNRGEKRITRLVPPGSVYWFEIEGGGDAAALAQKLWLSPLGSDKPTHQPSRDGYGLCLAGVYTQHPTAEGGSSNDKEGPR